MTRRSIYEQKKPDRNISYDINLGNWSTPIQHLRQSKSKQK